MVNDISAYYENDIELNTDGLVTAVMDAGKVGDKRYVLPLRYDIPVLYADTALLEGSGINAGEIASIVALMDIAIELEDAVLSDNVLPFVSYRNMGPRKIWIDSDGDGEYDGWTETNSALNYAGYGLSYFGDCIDYETESVTLTTESLVAFMKKYTALIRLINAAPVDEMPAVSAMDNLF